MEDRTAAGSSFYPSLLLSAHLCFLCTQVLAAAVPLQATALYAHLANFVFCSILAYAGIPLCSIIFSPHSLRRESFLFLKVSLSLGSNPWSDAPG